MPTLKSHLQGLVFYGRIFHHKARYLKGFAVWVFGYKGWHFPKCLFPVEIALSKVSGWDLSCLPGAEPSC